MIWSDRNYYNSIDLIVLYDFYPKNDQKYINLSRQLNCSHSAHVLNIIH
jgi:hypothetical protein